MPGVLAVYSSAELKGYGTLKCIVSLNNRDGTPLRKPRREALAVGKVRYVGDPVACVVAETVAQAKDAAEAVTVDIEPLPIVTMAEAGAQPGAPQLYDDVPGNVALDFHFGDTDAVNAAFARAAHVTRLKLLNSRVAVNPMEPRAALGTFHDGTLHAPRLLARRHGHARQYRRRDGRRRQGRAHPHRPGRRLVRHEGAGVSRIYLPAARRARAGPPGEMDRRALGKLRLRRPRPRPPR